jgi:uncharacterized protein YsxB (DUF464 family)
VSNRDTALQASQKLHGHQRAGQAGSELILCNGVNTIDVSRISGIDKAGHTFLLNTTIEGINPKAGEFNQEDCSLNPPVRSQLATVIVFVKALTFADGSLWSTSGPEIPQQLDAQTPAPAPSAP